MVTLLRFFLVSVFWLISGQSFCKIFTGQLFPAHFFVQFLPANYFRPIFLANYFQPSFPAEFLANLNLHFEYVINYLSLIQLLFIKVNFDINKEKKMKVPDEARTHVLPHGRRACFPYTTRAKANCAKTNVLK